MTWLFLGGYNKRKQEYKTKLLLVSERTGTASMIGDKPQFKGFISHTRLYRDVRFCSDILVTVLETVKLSLLIGLEAPEDHKIIIILT